MLKITELIQLLLFFDERKSYALRHFLFNFQDLDKTRSQ